MMNMFWEPLDFERARRRGVDASSIDTFASSPHDIVDPGAGVPFALPHCPVQGRSIVVLRNGG